MNRNEEVYVAKQSKAKEVRNKKKSSKRMNASYPTLGLRQAVGSKPHIRYTVSMPEPWTHYLEVCVEVQGLEAEEVELQFPAWTPGSYKIREFARNVSELQAYTLNQKKGGRLPLDCKQISKDSWRITSNKKKQFFVSFRTYCFEWSVRTAHVDESHAFFQSTNILPYFKDYLELPALLEIIPYADWKVACPLARIKGKGNIFFAPYYDILADAPVEVGSHQAYCFQVDGKPHEIALYGWGNHDADQMVQDFAKIVRAAKKHFSDQLPYDNYLFILHLLPTANGGLEHLNAQVSAWPSLKFSSREEYEDFLSLISHEFWHTWNVKRIRPNTLGPFDYSKEQYTEALWIMEGLTVYYEWIVLLRAGLVTPERVLKAWSQELNRFSNRPGNQVMSLKESSFLAWTKLYLADENFVNSGISYYLKGGLVGLLLDLKIRERTQHKRSLDDVMHLAFERYGWPQPGFKTGGFEDLVLEVVLQTQKKNQYKSEQTYWKGWFREHLEAKTDLRFEKSFKDFGLKLGHTSVEKVGLDGKKQKLQTKAWAGWEVIDNKGEIKVQLVRLGSPASRAGVSAHDEIIALNRVRVNSKATFDTLFKTFYPGQKIEVSVFRSGLLQHYTLELGEVEAGELQLSFSEKATLKQKQARKKWLGA